MAKKSSGTRTARRSAAAAPSVIFTGLSDRQVGSLRAAKQTAAARYLKPARMVPFAALLAAASPMPETNVVGVGIGEQLSAGKYTGVMAVKFLVRIKYPDNQVPKEHRLPAT